MTEQQLHAAVAETLHLMLPRDEQWVRDTKTLWTTFPAGGGGKVRGALLKRLGLLPGVPDIILVSRGTLHGIELKTARGRVKPEQKAAHKLIELAGGHVFVARSVDDVIGFVRAICPKARNIKSKPEVAA